MTDSAESHVRKALNRLRRATEKALLEVDALEGALAIAEGEDFPRRGDLGLRSRLTEVLEFTDEESARLQEKILQAGGLEPGRVRRSTG
jgi:hypothetical protein